MPLQKGLIYYMDLTKANYLEYVLYLFRDYASNNGKDIPEYRIVWKTKNELFFGTTLSWDSTMHDPIKTKLNSKFEPLEFHQSISDEHEDKFPTNVRYAWFNKYDKPSNNMLDLCSNPTMLLIEAVDFVNSLDFDDSPLQPYFKDFESLTTGVKLPFLLVSKDIDLTPVSLIKVEEN